MLLICLCGSPLDACFYTKCGLFNCNASCTDTLSYVAPWRPREPARVYSARASRTSNSRCNCLRVLCARDSIVLRTMPCDRPYCSTTRHVSFSPLNARISPPFAPFTSRPSTVRHAPLRARRYRQRADERGIISQPGVSNGRLISAIPSAFGRETLKNLMSE